MLNPFVDLLSEIIYLYNIVLLAWIIISWLITLNVVNRYQPLVLRPLRKLLPDLGGIDIAPIILFLLLRFLNNALYTYFYTY